MNDVKPTKLNAEQEESKLPSRSSGNMFIVQNSESIIWEELRHGDVGALGELYDLFIDSLFEYGMRQMQDKEHVMDCIHDLFFDLHKYRRKLSQTDNVKYYLFKSLKRKIYKGYHKRNIPVALDSTLPGELLKNNRTKSHEDTIILSEIISEKNAKLSAVLNKLSEKQKKALFLRYNQDKSYEEIAMAMDISIESARTTIYRAIKTLRK